MRVDDIWVAHEHPDRTLTYGAWICDCATCIAVVARQAHEYPGIRFVLKARCSRWVVTIAEVNEAFEWFGDLEPLLADPDDYLREVFVAQLGCEVGYVPASNESRKGRVARNRRRRAAVAEHRRQFQARRVT